MDTSMPLTAGEPAGSAAQPGARTRLLALSVPLTILLAFLFGCASAPSPATNHRRFDFQKDTFSYTNELVWEYHFDARGKWTSSRRVPPASYSHHCFVVARSARQFFLNARFAPGQPIADESTYRKLIRQVVSSNPRHPLPEARRILIPGYPDLRAFSQAQRSLLQEECGGAWQSYFQRGHWRMLWPFSRRQQAATADQILAHLRTGEPIVVHVVRFPQLTINHAVVIFKAEEAAAQIRFETYDPNRPAAPVWITFDRATRTFDLPANDYFPGGRVDLYEIYHRWNY